VPILDVLKFTCLSFYYRKQAEACLPEFRQRGIRVFLDSGAFTYLMRAQKTGVILDKKIVDRVLVEYAAWVRKINFQFDFCATFDYVREPKEVIRVTQRLKAEGLSAVPVYHGTSSLNALRQYIDAGHKFILISKGAYIGTWSMTRPFLDQVFNITEKYGIACHGLACTGPEIIKYPWHSVDSARWIKAALYGWLLEPKGDWLCQRAVTSRRSTLPKQQLIENPIELAKLNALTFINMWKKRKLGRPGKRTLF
jgi:hypothetical protein